MAGSTGVDRKNTKKLVWPLDKPSLTVTVTRFVP
jgi:hypothetical protein